MLYVSTGWLPVTVPLAIARSFTCVFERQHVSECWMSLLVLCGSFSSFCTLPPLLKTVCLTDLLDPQAWTLPCISHPACFLMQWVSAFFSFVAGYFVVELLVMAIWVWKWHWTYKLLRQSLEPCFGLLLRSKENMSAQKWDTAWTTVVPSSPGTPQYDILVSGVIRTGCGRNQGWCVLQSSLPPLEFIIYYKLSTKKMNTNCVAMKVLG